MISNLDLNLLMNVFDKAKHHSSGGSYDMVAMWKKGGHVVWGKNRLTRPAHKIDSTYPELCGIHAELDVWKQNPNIKGGTIYIGGYRSSSGLPMNTTKPCKYCSAILFSSKIRKAVFFVDGNPTICSVPDLIKDPHWEQ